MERRKNSPSLKHDGMTKQQKLPRHITVWICCGYFPFCLFFQFPQGAIKATERRYKLRFCGHFVVWPSIGCKNEQTTWPYPSSIHERHVEHCGQNECGWVGGGICQRWGKAKKKNMCVYCHMLKKIRVGRSEILFFFILFFITKLM